QFQPWSEETRQGFVLLDESQAWIADTLSRYRLFNEGLTNLSLRCKVHPLEVADLLALLATDAKVPAMASVTSRGAGPVGRRWFGGFSGDTFRFLAELREHNARAWMEGQRERYHFSVRRPMVELCQALAERYVQPVLGGEHGWDMETTARNGRALT